MRIAPRLFARQRAFASFALAAVCLFGSAAPARAQEAAEAQWASLNRHTDQMCDQGRCAEAIPLATQALELAARTWGEAHVRTATSYRRLSLLHAYSGDYARALELAQKAVAIEEKALDRNDPQRAVGLTTTGALYYQLGHLDTAKDLYERALKIFRRTTEIEPGEAAASSNLGLLYFSTGRRAEAEPLLETAREAFAADPRQRRNLAEVLHNLALLHLDSGRTAQAERHVMEALRLGEQQDGGHGPATAGNYDLLAAVFEAAGRHAQAEESYRRGLAIRERLLDPLETAVSHENLGDLCWRLDRPAEAARHFDAAFSLLSSVLVRNLIAGQTGQGMEFLEAQAASFQAMISFHLGRGAADKAYDVVAFYKGLHLDAASAARRTAWKDPQARARRQEFVQANERLALLVNAALRSARAPAADLEREIGLQQRRVAELDSALANASAAYRSNRDALRADAATVRAALPRDVALIDILRYRRWDPKATKNRWQEQRYAAFVVTRDRVVVADLGPAPSIDALAEQLHGRLDDGRLSIQSAPDESGYRRLAQELHRKVFAPVASALAGFSRVIVSPDGVLSKIPFVVLVDERERYLVERYTFSHAASAREVIRATGDGTAGSGALLVGDPDYDLGVPRGSAAAPSRMSLLRGGGFSGAPASSSFDLGRLAFGRLEETADEVKAAARAAGLGAQTLFGPAATETAVKRNAPGRRVLFFSTHGYYLGLPLASREQTRGGAFSGGSAAAVVRTPVTTTARTVNPLALTGLAFAGANASRSIQDFADDGLLTAAEVVNLDLSGAQLVVLSACVTGLGELSDAQGMMGLRYAFTLAGARTVAATSWSVPSIETKLLMERWMPRALAGEGPAASLRDEQVKLIDELRHSGRTTHPHFWGAFTVSGRAW